MLARAPRESWLARVALAAVGRAAARAGLCLVEVGARRVVAGLAHALGGRARPNQVRTRTAGRLGEARQACVHTVLVAGARVVGALRAGAFALCVVSGALATWAHRAHAFVSQFDSRLDGAQCRVLVQAVGTD